MVVVDVDFDLVERVQHDEARAGSRGRAELLVVHLFACIALVIAVMEPYGNETALKQMADLAERESASVIAVQDVPRAQTASYGIVATEAFDGIRDLFALLHQVSRRPVMTLDEALHRVERMIGTRLEWTRLEAFLPETEDGEFRKSALASSFVTQSSAPVRAC